MNYKLNSGYKDSHYEPKGNDFSMNFMTSLEISRLTGRSHNMVMRSIRNMEPSWEKVAECKFALCEYKDTNGRMRPMYKLTKEECLYIATKFNDEARAKLIRRWKDLETGQAEPRYKAQSEAELILQLAQQNVERERKMRELDSRQTRLEEKVEELEVRTLTSNNYSTVVGFSSLHGLYLVREKAALIGKTASSICKSRNIEMGTIPDPRFGTVRTYPDDIIKEAYLKFYPFV